MLRSSELPIRVTPDWGQARWALPAALLAVLLVFAPTWTAMAQVWMTSETFGHGIVVAPISLWLVWRERERLLAMQPSTSWVGVLGLLVCCLAWLLAELAGINVIAQFAVTGMLASVCLAVLGPRLSGALAFPLLFFFFMVPAGEALNPPLMEGTAEATVWALHATGVPVYREGLQFALPTGRWSVVEACSGLRYVLAAAMLGALFAYLNFTTWSRRLAFFAAAIGVAVVANWIRAYLIVMIGHLSRMRWGTGDDHEVYGWVFFGITMFALFWMGARWRDAATTTAGSAQDLARHAERALPAPSRHALPVLISVLALVGLSSYLSGALRHVQPRTDVAQGVARGVAGFTPGAVTFEPVFEGSRTTVRGVLDPAHGTELFLAYFADQGEGHEMIAFGNTVLSDTDKRWRSVSKEAHGIELARSAAVVSEWRVRSAQEERLVWSWYTVGGRVAATDYKAKALTAWAMLTGAGDHSTVTVLSTRLGGVGSDLLTSTVTPDQLEAARRRLTDQSARWPNELARFPLAQSSARTGSVSQ